MSWNLQGITEPINKPVLATGFKSVFDFKLPRSIWAAVGFYLFHFVLSLLMCALAAAIAAPLSGAKDKEAALDVALITARLGAFLYAVVVCVAVISARKLWKDWRYILAFVVTLPLAYIGSMFGLLPPAIILALKPKEKA
jgi:hypothetical protein